MSLADVGRPAIPPFSLESRVCVVTGALGLIGREICEGLLEAGGRVVVTDLDGAACRLRAEELAHRFRGRASGHPLDVTRPESLAELRDRVMTESGRLDVLINSAAVNDVFDEGGPAGADPERLRLESYPLAAWQRSLAVNLTGTFLSCQVLGSEMARQRGGSIVNIASTYGLVAPDQRVYRRPDGSQRFWKSAAYPASKGGVIALSRYLATYWADRGVRVNVLCPGGVHADQEEHFVQSYSARTPLGRMARAAEYRGPTVFLASDASSYMTGANLVVDGGWTAW